MAQEAQQDVEMENGTTDEFDADAFDAPVRGDAFVVDLDGFEGPLDLLLALVREHKLDLAQFSILELAQQYLDFIECAKMLSLEIAADYLVMAAWLAFLKSKLLLPAEDGADEPTGEELAVQLAHRLRRLEAMRDAAAKLFNRNHLGRDFFARGMPEGIRLVRQSKYDANIYDLLKAYAIQRQRMSVDSIHFAARPVWSVQDARERLEAILGTSVDWAPIDALVRQYMGTPKMQRTALASSLGASLEMTREGLVELRQEKAFASLFIRKRSAKSA